MFKNVKYSRQQNAENYKSQLDSLLTVFFWSHQHDFKGLSGYFACTVSGNLVIVCRNSRDGNKSQFVAVKGYQISSTSNL